MIGDLASVNLTLAIVVVVFGLILLVLWLLLPFAVFASRRLLRDILAEQRKTNELLAAQRDRQR